VVGFFSILKQRNLILLKIISKDAFKNSNAPVYTFILLISITHETEFYLTNGVSVTVVWKER